MPIHRTARSEPLEARRHLDAGSLDTSYGTQGVANGITGMTVADIAAQSSGKSIVVGYSGSSFEVVRYDANGALDPTFGNGGIVYVSFAAYQQTSAAATTVFVQSDDRILIGGWARQLSIANAVLVRLNVDGTLDTTFDSDGIQEVDNYGDDDANTEVDHIALQSDGKIVVAGQAQEFSGDGTQWWGVARFNSNGSFDTTFDGDGHRRIGFVDDKSTYVRGLAIDMTAGANNGKIVLSGIQIDDQTHSRIALARLNASGSYDSGLDGDGRLLASFTAGSTSSSAGEVVVQPSGKYVIAAASGSTQHTSGLIRFNADGTVDTTFGSAGLAQVPLDGNTLANELVLSQTGKILIAGSNNNQMSISCFSVDGVIDPYFGTGGTRLINPTANNDSTLGFARSAGGTLYALTGNVVNRGVIVRLFDRRAATVSVGSFDPVGSESGDQASFLVGRLEKLTTSTRIYFSTPGTATPPGVFPVRPRDYDGTGITFGNGSSTLTYVDVAANSTFSSVFLTPVNDATIEGDEQTKFTILASDTYDIGTPGDTTIVIRDNDFAGGPVVSSAALNYLTGPQTLTFKFNVDVSPSLSDADLILGGPAGMPTHSFTFDNVTDIATVTFNGILPDGNYTAKIVGSGVQSAAGGIVMGSDYTLPFFFLNGDADHDHDVDFNDLVTIAQNYGLSGDYAHGNFNYSADGLIDFNDLVILAQHYGKTLVVAETAPSVTKTSLAKKRVNDGLLE